MQAGKKKKKQQVCVAVASQAPPPHSLHWSLRVKLPSGWLLKSPPHLWAEPHRGQRSAAELDELSCEALVRVRLRQNQGYTAFIDYMGSDR